ncbi:methyltransferase domain-containing protein [uncultured Brevundimonas sp.]|uniref:methyltransferase domain-containing protein n=1 Tax=uncultured Brevundimonas sp. TaxID=213418 RepID=UPI0026142DE9|nr:methyltransferase domain-containing protein [uncultured Brevundimonas sp.]
MGKTPMEKRRGWHWTDYWRSGREEVMTVTTPSGVAVFDTGPIWRAWFAGFEDGARLLDLATGSGQVAGHAAAAAAAAGRTFDITGVDYAEVRPVEGLRLLGGVALETLPFAAGQFDGASSQFGIEYADTRPALTELARVLKPGGRVLMLLHHAGGVITRQTAAQIAAYDRVMANGAAVRQARRAFHAHHKRLPPATIRAAEEALREAVGRAKDRLDPDPAFDTARYLVGYLADLSDRIAAYDAASALARLEVFETGNAAWRRRQQAQTRAALDAAGMDAFVERAARAGLALADRAEHRDARGALVAWRVEFRREA